MTASAVVFLAGVVAAIAVGLGAGPATVRVRRALRDRGERLEARLGQPVSLVAFASVASAGLVALGLLIGYLAAGLEGPVDEPAFRWAVRQFDRSPGFFGHDWYRWATTLTKMGDSLETRVVVVVAAVGLAVVWRRRRPWIPLVVITGTYLVAYVAQRLLTRAVDRGHPPAAFGVVSLGTFPSGGCLRIVAVWGIIVVFVVRSFPRAPRWLVPGLAVLVAVAAWTEAYTRMYLLKHWLTDIIGGVAIGTVLLLVAAATADWCIGDGEQASPSP